MISSVFFFIASFITLWYQTVILSARSSFFFWPITSTCLANYLNANRCYNNREKKTTVNRFEQTNDITEFTHTQNTHIHTIDCYTEIRNSLCDKPALMMSNINNPN